MRTPETPSRSEVRADVWLDAQSSAAAQDALLRCCGSRRWAAAMLARRPFGSPEALTSAARAIWSALEPEDYLEAFSRHPPIGANLAALRAKFETTLGWSSEEQSGVAGTDAPTLAELAAANEAYRARFGFTFILCATGKSAREVLAALRLRLAHERAVEIRCAAAEQAQITEIRLEKLAGPAR